MENYFNTLNFRQKLENLSKCRFISDNEFSDGIKFLKDKKIVIIGCGSQGLNQGMNMRDSGLNISYAFLQKSILNKSNSWLRATKYNFNIGTYEELVPQADLVINLTPDKQHSNVIKKILPLMKGNSTLGYSHGFNIVEMGENIPSNITVILVAPKCPGTEVRKEYKRGFGVPALIAVHQKNDPNKNGINIAKSWAFAIGSHRAGVLESSFIAEVKSDLMGEQTILCGLLQTSSLFCFDQMVSSGINSSYASKLIQYGWEVITESLKLGGITLMMDRLSNSAKIRAFFLSEQLKKLMKPLFEKHMDNILSGDFSKKMMMDWNNNDIQLLNWRNNINKSNFENAPKYIGEIKEQDYFNNGTLMVALIKAGIELSFEIMNKSGISAESAYYESLHELPLIANTIARKRLLEMNIVISDTAEYGSYLFTNKAIKIFNEKLKNLLTPEDLGRSIKEKNIDNIILRNINNIIRQHSIEIVGYKLRNYMQNMKNISVYQNFYS